MLAGGVHDESLWGLLCWQAHTMRGFSALRRAHGYVSETPWETR